MGVITITMADTGLGTEYPVRNKIELSQSLEQWLAMKSVKYFIATWILAIPGSSSGYTKRTQSP